MVLLDFVLLVPLIYGLIKGLFNGLITELVSIVAVLLGVFFAHHYAKDAEQILSHYVQQDGIGLSILSYMLIFSVVMIAAFAFSFLLTKVLQAMALGLLNRFLGGIFGLLKSFIVMLMLVYLFQPYIIRSTDLRESSAKSTVYNTLSKISSKLGGWISDSSDDIEESNNILTIQVLP